MEIAKIVGLSITCAIVVICVKNVNPELASIVTVCAGVLILSLAVSYISDFLALFSALGDYAELGKITIKIVIKIIGISYLIEFSSGLIEDFGLKSLSDKIVFVGKIAILTTAYPIIEKLIKTVTELI
jgi:stage III sporulation protein AD